MFLTTIKTEIKQDYFYYNLVSGSQNYCWLPIYFIINTYLMSPSDLMIPKLYIIIYFMFSRVSGKSIEIEKKYNDHKDFTQICNLHTLIYAWEKSLLPKFEA